MAKKSSREVDILNGPILKNYIMFVIPVALGYVLQLLFNATDIMVVGQFVGAEALAAVGSTTALVNIYINIYAGLATGVNVLVARAYASGSKSRVTHIVHASMGLALACGILFLIVGVATVRPLLVITDTPEDIIDMAALYLYIFCLSVPGAVIYNFGAAILRSIGDTQRPTYYLLVAGIVNVIINLVSVICFHMGVAGVAIGTAVSNYLSCVLIIYALIRERSSVRLYLSKINLKRSIVGEILTFGVPIAIQNSFYTIPNIMIQSAVNGFGSLYVAGNSAAQSLEGFQLAFLSANGAGATTFISQHVGAGKYKRADKVFGVIVLVSTVISLSIGAIFVIFRMPLLGLYNSEAAVLAIACRRLILMVMTDFLDCGMSMISYVVRGWGKSVPPMVITIIFVCGFRMLWLICLFPHFRTYEFVLMAWPVSWILAIIAHFAYYKHVRKSFPDYDVVPGT